MKRSMLLIISLTVCFSTSVFAETVQYNSYLGNRLTRDRDTYSFSGFAGDVVSVTVEPLHTCFDSGHELRLIVRDNIAGVRFKHIDTGSSVLNVQGELPVTGEYYVVVEQNRKTPVEERYSGLYEIGVDSTAAVLELNPLRNVESTADSDDCGANNSKQSHLGNSQRTDRDSYRFYGHAGETVYIQVLHEGACPVTGSDVDLIIAGTKGCGLPPFKEHLYTGFPEPQVEVTLPSTCYYIVIVRQAMAVEPELRYDGLYGISVSSQQSYVELQPLADVESTYEGVTYWYLDSDDDGFGDSAYFICGLDSDPPPDGYVANYLDCDDGDPKRHLLCELEGYTFCYSPYEQQCNPGVFNVTTFLDELDGQDVNKDKFAWPSGQGLVTPGGVTSGNKRHLQSIQYFDNDGLGRGEKERFLAVTMSDEHNHESNIVLVKTRRFGSERGGDDEVVHQTFINDAGTEHTYNHPGGSQLIGEFLFVALEDFENESRPQIGVWKINRGASPTLSFKYLIDIYRTHPDFIDHPEDLEDPAKKPDKHCSAVGITRLKDRTYLLAAGVKSGCDDIIFLKSKGTSLDGTPEFHFIDEWHKVELYPGGDNFSDCDPQNMNLVTDRYDGGVYAVMFGNEGVYKCGGAMNDDQVFGYRLHFTADSEMKLQFTNKENVSTGDCCDPFVGVTGTNFDAGSGLWICPDGKNRISVLATEHYDSCGSGKSRWGVSENWKWN